MFFSERPFRSLLVLWSLVALIWMAQFHPLSFLSAVPVAVALFFQDRVTLSVRQMGAVAIVALISCYACTRSFKYGETGYFMGVGTLSLTLLAVWLLGLSLLIAKHGPYRRAPLFLSCAVVVGCSMSSDLKSVGVLAGVAVLLLLLSLRESLQLRIKGGLVIPVLVTVSLMVGLSVTATWSERKISYLAGLFSLIPASGFSFPQTASLSSLQKWAGSDIVVIRGYGENPPLYLVGRTFTEFDPNSFWRRSTTKEELRPDEMVEIETPDGPQTFGLFDKTTAPDAKPGKPFAVEFPNGGKGFTFYLPQHKYGMAAELKRLHRYKPGLLQVLARDTFRGTYYLFPYDDGWVRHEAPAELSPEDREKYLALPEKLTPLIAELAEERAGKVSDPTKKAAFITNFLQQNFTYGYDYPFESSQTALEEFLSKRPPAHCEFFATAGALMMRSQGVPARYVNGFVMQEKSLTGDYYVVRLKHAHAWVEAYIEGEGWVTFDPTPPGVLGSPDDKAGYGKALMEMLTNSWRRLANFFSASPTEMLQQLKNFIRRLTLYDLAKVLLLVTLWFLWKRFRRPRVKPRQGKVLYDYKAGRDEELTPSLEAVVELVQPQEWQREQWETPKQWLSRLEQSDLDSSSLTALGQFVDVYTQARFNGEGNPKLGEEVRSILESLQKRFKGKSLKARERPANERDPEEVQTQEP